MRKNDKQLKILKQIAKQLLLHRVWNGKNQESIAKIIGVSFQQYQKVEKCENRCLAEQLLAICDNYNWDPRTILKADPVDTLDAWVNRRKPKTRPNIVNNPEKIREKLDKLNDNAYKWYFHTKSNKPLILTKEMEV